MKRRLVRECSWACAGVELGVRRRQKSVRGRNVHLNKVPVAHIEPPQEALLESSSVAGIRE